MAKIIDTSPQVRLQKEFLFFHSYRKVNKKVSKVTVGPKVTWVCTSAFVVRNSQKKNESLKLPPSQKTVLVRGNRPWGSVCSLYCGVTNQQACYSRSSPDSHKCRRLLIINPRSPRDTLTEMDFVALLYLKSNTSVNFTEPDRHVCADKSELHLKWNAYWPLGESQHTYGPSALPLRSWVWGEESCFHM